MTGRSRASTEGTVAPVVTPGVDPDAPGVAAATIHSPIPTQVTDDQLAGADVDEAAANRAAALLALQAVAEAPMIVAPPAKFALPVYVPTGAVREWETGPTTVLYLVVSKMYATVIGEDRYVSAPGGTVVSLEPEHAARGVKLGQLVEQTG